MKREVKGFNWRLGRYVGALVAVCLAFFIHLSLSSVFGFPLLPYILFYPAVMLVAILAGLGPALFAITLAALLAWYWIIPPQGQFEVERKPGIGLALFVVMGVIIALVAELYKRARRKVATFEQESQAREIEERLRTESQRMLQASETRLRTLVAGTFEGIAVSEQARFTDANEQLAHMLGFSREELIGMEVMPLIAPEDRSRVMENMEAGRESHFVHEMLRKDGARIMVEAHGQTIDLEGHAVRLTALRDITEQKRAERTLRESESDHTRARTAVQNQNLRLHLLNEAATQLLTAEDPEQAMAAIYERIAIYFQTSGFFEFEINDPGDELSLKSCMTVEQSPQQCGITHLKMGEGIVGRVAQQRRAIILEQVQRSDDPNTEFLKGLGVRAYACYPLIVAEHLLGTLSFASRQRENFAPEDVEFFQTVASHLALAKERLRLRNELQRHAANLEQTVRERTGKLRELVAELEHMSYSIVHDLRAPLRAVEGFTSAIQEKEGEQLCPASRDLFQRIVNATARMDLLITDALNYNKAVREELPLRPVDVGKLLREMLRSYPEFQPPHAEVRLEGEFPPILGNEAGLTQCFSNLLDNAVKFVRPGVAPRVRVWAEVNEPPEVVRIWVEDEGTGIQKQGQERIFDMFQRLHGPEYEGTGIGLALVRKVMERMGGHVGVESEVGKGSRFWLELNLAHQPCDPADRFGRSSAPDVPVSSSVGEQFAPN